MAENRKLAVFRADASSSIGAGHIVRCSALAEALAAEGWLCTFATSRDGAAAMQGLTRFDCVTLDDSELLSSAALRRAFPDGCALLVVDHYGLDAVYETALRGWTRQILAIDDLANRAHDCDVLIDQTAGRSVLDYRKLVPANCQILTGADYALLRPEFERERHTTLEQRRFERGVQRILVTFGATDPQNLTMVALDAIEHAAPAAGIDVVLGAAAPHLDKMQARIANLPSAKLHRQTRDMAKLMAQADLAIGAAGSASWERCCLGLPSIAVITADNQKTNAEALRSAAVALVVTKDEIADALGSLSSSQARQAMASRAASLCDGLGARRVASAIQPIFAVDGNTVLLRRATASDADRMHVWQNHPDVRRFARNPSVPEIGEHRAWLKVKLADPDCLLAIVEHAGEAAGVVRLDAANSAGRREVSIYIDPAKHRLGIGRAALAQLRRLVPACTIEAHVLPGNESSKELFTAAGYRMISPGTYFDAAAKASA